jgi:hypothetical protein
VTHSDGEHLVDVGIEEHPLPVWRWHEASPVAERLESVVNQHSEITLLRGTEWESESLLVSRKKVFAGYRSSPNISIAVVPVLRKHELEIHTIVEKNSRTCLAVESS